jgi:ATP-dependent exoDNAse (exonuclease V) beta subunit
MEAVMRELPEPGPQDVLGECFRSRPALVGLTSELFARAFEPAISEERVRVRARRAEPPGLPPALWRWRLSASRQDEAAAAIARGVRILLGLEQAPAALVTDGRSAGVRPVRAGDVAILCRTKAHCDDLAEALELAGVRAARARTGLLSTPESILALACLRRALDKRDSLSTAELAVLTSERPGPDDWLLERLRYLETGQPQEDWRRDDPTVAALDRLHRDLPALSPSEALDRALDAGQVHRRVLAWGRSPVRLGNLEALRSLATDYEASCAQLRAGASVAGFLHWLSLLSDEEKDAQAEGTGADAVQVLTVHGSKGLEWPVVILGDLQWSRDAEVFGLTVVDPRPRLELDRPLASRWLRLWPWPWGQQSTGTGLETVLETHPASLQARAAHDSEALRLLYVAMTRARDLLVLPARLKSGRLQQAWLDRLSPAPDTDSVLALPEEDGDSELLAGALHLEARVSTLAPAEPAPPPVEAVEWFPAARHNPPDLPAGRAASKLSLPPGFTVPAGPPVTIGAPIPVTGELDAEAMGNAVHGFFASDDPAAGASAREAAAAAILLRHGAAGALPSGALVRCSDELRAALTRLHGPPGRELREWPVALRLAEVVASGWVDLAWELDGGWVVIDYKTRGTGGEDFLARAAEHGAQLGTYALALTRVTGKPLLAAYVHLVLAGLLVPIELPAGAALEQLVLRSVTQG